MIEKKGGYTTDVVVRDEVLTPSTFAGIMQQAEMLVKSGFLPDHIKNAQQAAAIILMGRELDIPPMQALRSIYVVHGNPSANAQLMGALIRRAGHSYHVDTLTETECAITFQRDAYSILNKPASYTHTVTMEEARRLHWHQDWDKQTRQWKDKFAWKRYPKALLFSRCLSAGARIEMSDAIMNIYTTEELDTTVTIDQETGELVPVVNGEVAELTEPTPETAQAPPIAEASETPDLAPVNASSHGGWWGALVKSPAKYVYHHHKHVINGLAKINYDA